MQPKQEVTLYMGAGRSTIGLAGLQRLSLHLERELSGKVRLVIWRGLEVSGKFTLTPLRVGGELLGSNRATRSSFSTKSFKIVLQLQQLPLFCSQAWLRVLTASVIVEKRGLKGPDSTYEQTLHGELERSAAWRLFGPQSSLFWGYTWNCPIIKKSNLDWKLLMKWGNGFAPRDATQGKHQSVGQRSRTSWWNDKGHLIHR